MADIPEDDELTPKQRAALEALVTHTTVRQAAQAAEISERQVYRYLKEPAFAEALREVRRVATQQAVGKLQTASDAAVVTLLTLLGKGNPPAVRLAAAAKVLDMNLRAIELGDIEQRLAALEASHAQKP